MLKNLLKYTLLLTPVFGVGQSKLDLGTASIVENYQQAVKTMSTNATEAGNEKVTLLVSIADESVVNELNTLGIEVISVSNNVAIVSTPVKEINAMEQLPGVKGIEKGRLQEAKMYFARDITLADDVIDGTGAGLPQAYTGKGVVTGLMDTGIDPNHITFMNQDLTENRVKAVYTYTGNSIGRPNGTYTTPEQISSFTTDIRGETHATHVSSIMSGSYKGNGNYALNGRIFNDSPIPYYGVATDADIVMTAGYLYDENILDGINKIISYAKAAGKPAVINLSLGSNTGPHDGSTAFNRYLAGLGKEAIIVVAAGNEGDTKCALNKTFNKLSPSVTTGISLIDPSRATLAGFWYDTADEFKFEFILYDTTARKEYVYEVNNVGKVLQLTTSDPKFGEAFAAGAYIKFFLGTDPDNGRFCNQMELYLPRGASSNKSLVPGVRITGQSRRTISGSINGGEFLALGIPGAEDGSTNGSISDMATGENIITVGAFTSSPTYSVMSGGQMSFEGATNKGELCGFSSYGTTFQGKNLPDICAPGALIVAGVSSYAYSGAASTYYSAITTHKSKRHYWAGMMGTSMACPFVAGSVALMLEADPTLDVEKVRNILKETAIAPPSSATSDEIIKWGAGRIDVLAAVKKVLDEKASVGTIFDDEARNFILSPIGNGYNVYVAGESEIAVTLYDAAGSTINTVTANDNTVDVDTSSLRPGVYIMAVQGNTQRHTAKIVVK